MTSNRARWNLTNIAEQATHIELKPRLVSSDLRIRLQGSMQGIGIANARPPWHHVIQDDRNGLDKIHGQQNR
jgi:hypothetical protein